MLLKKDLPVFTQTILKLLISTTQILTRESCFLTQKAFVPRNFDAGTLTQELCCFDIWGGPLTRKTLMAFYAVYFLIHFDTLFLLLTMYPNYSGPNNSLVLNKKCVGLIFWSPFIGGIEVKIHMLAG